MKNVSCMILVALMLSGIVGKAQNISGNWKSSEGFSMNVKQSGTTISFTFQSGGFTYEGAGFIRNSKTVHVIIICEGSGSVAKYYDKWKINGNTMERQTECIEGGTIDKKGRTGSATFTKNDD